VNRRGKGVAERHNTTYVYDLFASTRNRNTVAQHTGEVMSPQRTDLVLAADVPNIEFCVLVRHGLDVEADGGNGGDVLVELELVEDSWRSHNISNCPPRMCSEKISRAHVLVLPAASRPSIRSRISLDPKILFIIFDIEAPIVTVALDARSKREVRDLLEGIWGLWESGMGSEIRCRD
jgi:hypothetical protein